MSDAAEAGAAARKGQPEADNRLERRLNRVEEDVKRLQEKVKELEKKIEESPSESMSRG